MLRKIKEKLVNWLLRGVVVQEIKTKKLIDKGNTLYVDIADFDHNSSDPGSPTESQMWYNSTDHILRYRNDSETVDISGGTDISDADAAIGDVKSPKTFYSVEEPRKTGTMPTVAIAPGSSAYPAGYHAGDGGGLPAVDTDLVTGSIKSGVTIFNVAGHTNVRDVSDANAVVGEVKSTKTFYAVGGAKKTGTMPTVAIVAGSDTYSAGYHAGDAGGLDAIDTDLAPANIKSGVNIFGKDGTLALTQDILVEEEHTDIGDTTAEHGFLYKAYSNTLVLISSTETFADPSLAVAVGVVYCRRHASGTAWTITLEMDGVVQESISLSADPSYNYQPYTLTGMKALAGSKVCLLRATKSYGNQLFFIGDDVGVKTIVCTISVGSVTL